MTRSDSPNRLSEYTRELASRGLSGEWGDQTLPTDIKLEDRMDTSGLSPDMTHAYAAKLTAEIAPLRIVPGELLVGAATLREGVWGCVPTLRWGSMSHTTADFGKVLAVGLRGLRAEIRARRDRGGLDEKGLDLLNAMEVCLDAASTWHGRYIAELENRIARSSGEERAVYERVLKNARRVPENPPTSFHEAVQSLWFTWDFLRLCGNWSALGRLDQMLGPYLKHDLQAGAITLDEAREILAHFWIKGTEWIIRHPLPTGSGDAQHYQNVVLSGIDASGRDVTNEVTYLILDIVEELHISDFPIAVRLNRQAPERLLRRIAEVQRLGGGTVAVYNEEVVIEALVKFGYPLEEAREFANDGCWEALIPGKTAFTYQAFDVLELLQQVLGLDDSSQVPAFDNFEQLYSAFAARLGSRLDELNLAVDSGFGSWPAQPVISTFIEGCIERARGYLDKGPIYTVVAPHAGGLANVANSLLAIKKLVYDERRMTLAELVAIIRSDWEDREELRQEVLSRVGAFGNDDEEADSVMARVFNDYTDLVARVRELNGVLRPAGISTFGREIEWRAHRKATADGHQAGEILATNFSPSPGTDRQGPTAVLKSYCKMNFMKLPNIGALELKILPSSLEGETGIQALVGLMRTFVELGGCFMHIDAVDTGTLLDAQQNPNRYPNLAVRVSGWSARFITLDKEWQDMIINRTQQSA